MRTSSGTSPSGAPAANSKLAESLVKIHQASEFAAPDTNDHILPDTRREKQVEDSAWQAEWEERRERIHRQLDFIEQQLTELETIDEFEVPSLTVFGLPDEANA